ncbi:MAG: hypothetical protein AB8B55_06620 [Mariniblastus sp.]
MSFPQGRMAADAVGLELGVAQLESDQVDTFEEFWSLLDSQKLPLELRQLLDQNGIRAAVMGSHSPTSLHQLVDPQPIDPAVMTKLEKQLDKKGLLRPKQRMVMHDRISNREGQAHPVATSETHPAISWVIRNGDLQTVGFGESVRGVMTITTFPNGDGSVRLIIRPQIHHGQSRQRVGVGDRDFLMQASQTVTSLDDLKFEVTLRAGESLVVAPTSDVTDLGKLFFGAVGNGDLGSGVSSDTATSKHPVPSHRVLLARLVQTQMDDLFSDANLGEKLTTAPRH